jgi:branched-subunit amino acid ABC-type transport system permease component
MTQIGIVGTEVPVYCLIIVAIAFLVYAGIRLFLNRSITGKAIRADGFSSAQRRNSATTGGAI